MDKSNKFGVFTGISVFSIIIILSAIFDSSNKAVYAQHTDVFNLDKDELPKKDIPIAPEFELITVEDRITYEVPVDRKKYEAKDLLMENIELWEIVDKSPFEWHQVDYYLEHDIVETHIRTFGKQECEHSRKGTIFWLKDGKKVVYWTVWSIWDCRPEEKREDLSSPGPIKTKAP